MRSVSSAVPLTLARPPAHPVFREMLVILDKIGKDVPAAVSEAITVWGTSAAVRLDYLKKDFLGSVSALLGSKTVTMDETSLLITYGKLLLFVFRHAECQPKLNNFSPSRLRELIEVAAGAHAGVESDAEGIYRENFTVDIRMYPAAKETHKLNEEGFRLLLEHIFNIMAIESKSKKIEVEVTYPADIANRNIVTIQFTTLQYELNKQPRQDCSTLARTAAARIDAHYADMSHGMHEGGAYIHKFIATLELPLVPSEKKCLHANVA